MSRFLEIFCAVILNLLCTVLVGYLLLHVSNDEKAAAGGMLVAMLLLGPVLGNLVRFDDF